MNDIERKEKEFHVYGTPGGGKTTHLAKIISNSAKKQQNNGEHLIISSFTKTAARELASRELPVPEQNIGTLHAICYRQIGKGELAEKHISDFNKENPGFALSKSMGVDADESAADQKFGSDGDAWFNKAQLNRARLIPVERWRDERIVAFHDAWTAWKEANELVDFTDMIDIALKNKVGPPSGVTVGIFDEVQDFTPMQMALIRMWRDNYLEHIMLAGDDDQCLFSFTGATPDVMLDSGVAQENKKLLEQSYRVPRLPQERADAWIRRIEKREPKTPRPRMQDGVVVDGMVEEVDYDLQQTPRIVEHIEELLVNKPRDTVMVLAACNYMLKPLIAELRAAGIPFGNRFRRSNGAWNPLHPSKGVSSASRLWHYLSPQGLEYPPMKLWTPQQAGLWLEMCSVKGLLKKGTKPELITMAKDKNIDDDTFIDKMLDCFLPGMLDEAVTLDPKWLWPRLSDDKKKVLDFPMAVLERFGKDALVNEPRLTVGTVHSVKGGQSAHVILFPDISLNAAAACQNQDGKESVIRQFYVGMTRCRESLYIARPASGMFAPI
jgi:DNA helicase II / ATP-dependent DNA helicase PcrA